MVEAVGDILTAHREYIMVAWQSIRGCFAKRELSRKHTIVVTFEQKWAYLLVYWGNFSFPCRRFQILYIYMESYDTTKLLLSATVCTVKSQLTENFERIKKLKI